MKHDERRVLMRRNARELTFEECQQVPGAIVHTLPCTIHVNPNGTCYFEGDCEPVPRCQQG